MRVVLIEDNPERLEQLVKIVTQQNTCSKITVRTTDQELPAQRDVLIVENAVQSASRNHHRAVGLRVTAPDDKRNKVLCVGIYRRRQNDSVETSRRRSQPTGKLS